MKTIVKTTVIVLIGSSMLFAGDNTLKLYDVKSGKIEYSMKGSGAIMGQKMKSVGKKRVIFDEYGAKNLTEENKVEKVNVMGQKNVTKTHTLTYMKEGMVYHVDFGKKRIMRMANMAASMGALMGGGKNMKQTGEAMMKSMGGKKTGTDKVLGYTCDVWELMGSKQCIYKGIPLRVETNMMGMKNTEIATKAEFDISLSKDDFKLPDFPIYNMDPSQPMENAEPLDKSKLDAMDAKYDTDMAKDMDEMAVKKAAFAKAMKDAGIKEGQRPTEAQEKAMMNSMMNAMGGEEAMLAKTKQEILGEAENIPQIIKCFENANSVKDANACEREYASEDPEHHTKWNGAIKADLLKDMRIFENAIPCIEKAKTFQAFRMCLPQE